MKSYKGILPDHDPLKTETKGCGVTGNTTLKKITCHASAKSCGGLISGGCNARPDVDAWCTNHDGNGMSSGEPYDIDSTSAASCLGDHHPIITDSNNYHDGDSSCTEKHDVSVARIVAARDTVDGMAHSKCPITE